MAGPSNDLDTRQTPRSFDSAMGALNADTARMGKDIKSEQEEMKPALKEASDLMASPRPQLGKMDNIPDEPSADTGKPGQEWIAATAVLAGIAGAFSRQHLTSALTAFAAGVQGLKQGQVQAYDQAFQKWKAAAEKAKANNELVLQKYQAAFEDRKASMQEIKDRISLIAIEHKDQIMYDASRRDDDTFMAQVYSQQRNADREFGLQTQRLKDEHAKFEQTVLDKYGLTSEQFGSAQQRLFDETKASAPPGETQQQFMKRYQEAWRMSGIGSGGASPDLVRAQGAMIKAGVPLATAIPGWGKAATDARQAGQANAIQQIMQDNPGLSAEDAGLQLAQAQVSYIAGKASVQQLTKMLGATRQAVDQLDFNIKNAQREMDKLGSTNLSPIINAIIRKEEAWTGDPAYSGLWFFMNGAAMEAARLQSGGQASIAQLHQGAADNAQQWANINMTPASWREVGQSMEAEGQNRIQNFSDAIRAMQVGGPGLAPPAGGLPAQTPARGGSDGWGDVRVGP